MGDIDHAGVDTLKSLLPVSFKSPPGICNLEGCTALASADYEEVCQVCFGKMCPAHMGVFTHGHNCPKYVSRF